MVDEDGFSVVDGTPEFEAVVGQVTATWISSGPTG
jgi:hypothetical protein